MSEKKSESATSPFEVPKEVREFAEKSVEQARQAFDQVLGASQSAIGAIGTPQNTLQAGAVDMSKQALSYAEENMSAALELADKMVRAGSVEEIAALQRDYLKSQMSVLGEQTRAFSESITKVAEATAKGMKKD